MCGGGRLRVWIYICVSLCVEEGVIEYKYVFTCVIGFVLCICEYSGEFFFVRGYDKGVDVSLY